MTDWEEESIINSVAGFFEGTFIAHRADFSDRRGIHHFSLSGQEDAHSVISGWFVDIVDEPAGTPRRGGKVLFRSREERDLRAKEMCRERLDGGAVYHSKIAGLMEVSGKERKRSGGV